MLASLRRPISRGYWATGSSGYAPPSLKSCKVRGSQALLLPYFGGDTCSVQFREALLRSEEDRLLNLGAGKMRFIGICFVLCKYRTLKSKKQLKTKTAV